MSMYAIEQDVTDVLQKMTNDLLDAYVNVLELAYKDRNKHHV
jgi:hypothetical protein